MTVKFKFDTLDKPFEANWPVKVKVPVDGGAYEEQEFTARFRLKNKEEVQAWTEGQVDEDAFRRSYFVGLGDGVELTPDLYDKLVLAPHTASAIFVAWQAFQRGALAGN